MSSSCIAIVDPISTGATLAAEAASRGYEVMAVYSMELTPDIRAMVPVKVEYLAEIEEQSTIKKKQLVRSHRLAVAVSSWRS
jgi:hypothetical protein